LRNGKGVALGCCSLALLCAGGSFFFMMGGEAEGKFFNWGIIFSPEGHFEKQMAKD
jgi:hypothetical protein